VLSGIAEVTTLKVLVFPSTVDVAPPWGVTLTIVGVAGVCEVSLIVIYDDVTVDPVPEYVTRTRNCSNPSVVKSAEAPTENCAALPVTVTVPEVAVLKSLFGVIVAAGYALPPTTTSQLIDVPSEIPDVATVNVTELPSLTVVVEGVIEEIAPVSGAGGDTGPLPPV